IVFDEAGHLVLVRHSYAPGLYLPGGGVKRGESPEGAVRRELAEEIGARDCDLAPFATYHSVGEGKRDTIHLFVARGARLSPRDNAEITTIIACDPDDLPDDLTPATFRRLAEVRGEAPPSATW
ncbi:MAG: NUDIX domain-containing protein, partial [Phenylobacterium sp.]